MATVFGRILRFLVVLVAVTGSHGDAVQQPLVQHSGNGTLISQKLFWELEELARIVDIAYCVGTAGLGIQKPFQCASRCTDRDFESFELVTVSVGCNTSDYMVLITARHGIQGPSSLTPAATSPWRMVLRTLDSSSPFVEPTQSPTPLQTCRQSLKNMYPTPATTMTGLLRTSSLLTYSPPRRPRGIHRQQTHLNAPTAPCTLASTLPG